MAAAAFTLHLPPGAPPQPESIGQLKAKVVDVVWVSTVANSTADATIEEEQLGLNKILGADFLGDVGAAYAGSDTVGSCSRTIDAAGDLVIAGLSVAGAALDLDDTDKAAARLRVWGY